jgi:hypothetical protein
MADAIGKIAGSMGGAGGAAPGGGLGGILSKVLPLASFGLGTYGNIKSGQAQQGNLDALETARKKYATMNPTDVSKMVMGATQPLNQGLVQGVGNQVNAMMGERGLSQAPGIFSGQLAQSLAPFEQQNQDAAMKIVMQQMGLPLEYAKGIGAAIPPGQSMTPALMMFLQSMGMGKPGASPSGGGAPAAAPGYAAPGADSSSMFPSDSGVPTGLPPTPFSPFPGGDMTTWGKG